MLCYDSREKGGRKEIFSTRERGGKVTNLSEKTMIRAWEITLMGGEREKNGLCVRDNEEKKEEGAAQFHHRSPREWRKKKGFARRRGGGGKRERGLMRQPTKHFSVHERGRIEDAQLRGKGGKKKGGASPLVAL